MSNMMNVHHAISEDGLYIPFEPLTRTAAKNDTPPPRTAARCCADKNLERNVQQLLGGILAYHQLRWNIATDRMQSSNDPEEAHFPSNLEVQNEYARVLLHARTCVTCLIKHGGDISTNHLKLLGILQLPTAIH